MDFTAGDLTNEGGKKKCIVGSQTKNKKMTNAVQYQSTVTNPTKKTQAVCHMFSSPVDISSENLQRLINAQIRAVLEPFTSISTEQEISKEVTVDSSAQLHKNVVKPRDDDVVNSPSISSPEIIPPQYRVKDQFSSHGVIPRDMNIPKGECVT